MIKHFLGFLFFILGFGIVSGKLISTYYYDDFFSIGENEIKLIENFEKKINLKLAKYENTKKIDLLNLVLFKLENYKKKYSKNVFLINFINNLSFKLNKSKNNLIKKNDGPFGLHTGVYKIDLKSNSIINLSGNTIYSYDYLVDLGVKRERPGLYALWGLIQSGNDLSSGNFNWDQTDELYGNIPSSINILGNIAIVPKLLYYGDSGNMQNETEIFQKYIGKDVFTPFDEKKYINFVEKLVERYDGDGINDMPGLKNPIKYWQIDNEPDFIHEKLQTYESFAHLQKITYLAIKKADPQAKVLIGGLAGLIIAHVEFDGKRYIELFDQYYLPILKNLNGKYVDIFDLHWYGTANIEYKIDYVFEHIKKKIIESGFDKNFEIRCTECGTYSGKPFEMPFDRIEQSEKHQAIDLVKRHINLFKNGFKKVFWAWGVVEGYHNNNSFFDNTGLVYDGIGPNDSGKGIKKLGYYTYKNLINQLNGVSLNNVKILFENNDYYGYGFDLGDSFVAIIWGETIENQKLSLSLNIPEFANKLISIYSLIPSESEGKFVINDLPTFDGYETLVSFDGNFDLELNNTPIIIKIVK